MKIINDGLPAPLYRAVSDQREPVGPREISITQLLGPPRIRQLMQAHWADLEEQASDRIWLADGNALHSLLHQYGNVGNERAERTMEMTWVFNGDSWHITGTYDHYDGDARTLTDWKRVGIAATYDGAKPEWIAQVNLYAYMLRNFDEQLPVDQVQIACIFRDWIKSKALTDAQYPQKAFGLFPVSYWSDDQCEAFINERLLAHSEVLPDCSPDEQWMRDTTYAVMKPPNKSASRVLGSLDEAERWAEIAIQTSGKGHVVVERPGVRTRCEQYCGVRDKCDQYRREHGSAP